ncbi:MAG TPA: ABC-type transport auxiliary lipoprotein family protein [Rhizomicrobium sp.]|nr:ABC-type transport auxiliary lipoprotein family protein [Rhizomicrobium sp.]
MNQACFSRRFFLISTASLAVSACGNLLGPPPASQIYVLRPALPAQGGEKVSWALAIDKPDASDALDIERIALAKSDTQLDYYANAVWPDRLPHLIQTALLAGFEATGRIDSVARDEDALHADYQLSTDIRDFEARYTTPDGAPTATVTIVAHMAEAHSRKIVANLTVNVTEPAASNGVDAVVQAFDTTLAKGISQIVTWALSLPPPRPMSTASDITPSEPPRGPSRSRSNGLTSPRQAPGGNELPVPGSATPPAP